MSVFIQGDNFDRVGGKGEEVVWNRVKEALSKRNILGYSRYPLFSSVGEKRKEPDILLLDKELGLIIIEVKSFSIDSIENIECNNWILKDGYNKTINPLAQSEDYLYAVKSKFDVDRNLRGKVRGQCFVALPNIDKNEWIKKGLDKYIDDSYFIFRNELSKTTLLNKILNQKSLIGGNSLDNESFRISQSILGHENNHVADLDYSLKDGTKGKVYNLIKNKMYDLDIQQEGIAKAIPPGPQRIRGIAGSGKTILICQKAAIMHLRHPEWKIAVVFFTQSLYDTITKTIDMYMKAFSNGEVSYSEDSNLKVLHAWGRKEKSGFYKEIANRNNCRFRNVNDVKAECGNWLEANNSINYISKKLLEETDSNLEQIFDAILIDEGQDLVGDEEYKYEDKQPFYYMAYKSLKPASKGSELKRLVWAYDELQSLNDKKIPSSKEIFGDNTLVTGSYKGGIKKSEIMKRCYRTPHQVLTTAHAVGMGFFRKDGLISGYTRREEWEHIGYEVLKGDFRKIGNEIKLSRPIQNSPNPINEFFDGDCIEFNTFNSEYDMIQELVKSIKVDIDKHNLSPSRDILIISLKESDKYNTLQTEIGRTLNSQGINFYIPSYENINDFVCKWPQQKSRPHVFWQDNAVTISQIGRAKGNEAPMVYIIGLEEIAQNESSISYRNKLFTALTRAKCWVKLMGVGNYSLYEEIEEAISSEGTFTFKFSKPKKDTNDNNDDNESYVPSYA